MNVRRWDLVHVIARDIQQPYYDGPPVYNGRNTVSYVSHAVTAVCGRKAKIYPGSRNQLTEDAPTCFVCIAGGYKDEQG